MCKGSSDKICNICRLEEIHTNFASIITVLLNVTIFSEKLEYDCTKLSWKNSGTGAH